MSRNLIPYHIDGDTVTLSDETLTTIADIPTLTMKNLYVTIGVATTALDQFVIQGATKNDATPQTLFITSGDYTGPEGILVGTSGDLTAISAGSTGWFIIEPGGLDFIRVRVARASGSNAVITINASGS